MSKKLEKFSKNNELLIFLISTSKITILNIFQTQETVAKSAMPKNGTNGQTTCKKSVRFATNVGKVRRSLIFNSNEDIPDMTDK